MAETCDVEIIDIRSIIIQTLECGEMAGRGRRRHALGSQTPDTFVFHDYLAEGVQVSKDLRTLGASRLQFECSRSGVIGRQFDGMDIPNTLGIQHGDCELQFALDFVADDGRPDRLFESPCRLVNLL